MACRALAGSWVMASSAPSQPKRQGWQLSPLGAWMAAPTILSTAARGTRPESLSIVTDATLPRLSSAPRRDGAARC